MKVNQMGFNFELGKQNYCENTLVGRSIELARATSVTNNQRNLQVGFREDKLGRNKRWMAADGVALTSVF